MTGERFFYHSFPRRSSDESVAQGLAILSAMLDRGLLLTPEQIEFRERLSDGSLSQPYKIAQRRVCFTELHPSELPDHSRRFGVFALEWDIRRLRQMGAIPVFYIPLHADNNAHEGVGAALVARLSEVQELLVRLERLEEAAQTAPSPHQSINVVRNAIVAEGTRCTVGGALDVLRYLQEEMQSTTALTSAVRALAGFFYPVRNLSFTDELGYYRQREWRILANILNEGRPVTTACTEDEVAILENLDPDFFGRVIDFPTGRQARSHQCQLYRQFQNEPFYSTIRRTIAPQKVVLEVRQLLKDRRIDIGVVSLESCGPAQGT